MNDDRMTSSELPPDLQALLDAAGVTDEESLQRALTNDPQLRERVVAFLQAQAQAVAARIAQDVARLEAAVDGQTVGAIWNAIPIELEEPFLDAAERRAAELGDTPEAERMRASVAALRQARQQREELERQPPVVRALLAFLQAPDDGAARQVFADRKALLQPYEAQRMADGAAESAPDELRARVAERAALLRELRGAAPQPRPGADPATGGLPQLRSEATFSVQQATVERDLIQVAGDFIDQTTINLLHPRAWTPPPPPAVPEDAIDRPERIAEVAALLAEAGTVAIGGRSTVALQGIAGIGKTTLAQLLVHHFVDEGRYLDGVLWEDLGPTVVQPEQVQPILDKWGALAAVGPEGTTKRLRFAPDAVRILLSRHQRLLVVLDNVWSLEAIRPLRDALPKGIDLIITTRIPRIMRAVGGRSYELGRLSDDEVRALISARLDWCPETLSAVPWLAQLVEGVERHTLALDVALRLLRDEGGTPASWQKTAQRILITMAEARDFDDLVVPEGEQEKHVAAVLEYSYIHGPLARIDGLQSRFRLLGAIAPSASFDLLAIAGLWNCDEPTASKALNDLTGAGLLERLEQRDGALRWRQHPLLRAYALALLHREGEYEAAAATYAQTYLSLTAAADHAGDYARIVPEVPHLRHAVTWAIANDLDLALDLIAASAAMQAAFSLVADGYRWAQELLAVAQARGNAAAIARAQGLLGNALQRAATMPGEDRGARLREALAAYDQALRISTPETVPLNYAATQNNRAVLLSELASVPGEDRGARLREALAAYDQALRFRTPETVPLDYAMTQGNLLNLHRALADLPGEDRRDQLRRALQCGMRAFALFARIGHQQYQQQAMDQLQRLHADLGTEFVGLWAELGAGPLPDWLTAEPDQPAPTALQAFEAALKFYLDQVRAAEASESEVTAWQAAVAAGEALLAPELAATPGVNWEALRAQLASSYTSLCIALENAGDLEASLAATERAIVLQPEQAMWRLNRAGTLIALGRLSEAAEELERARALEPDAPRLAELAAALEQARNPADTITFKNRGLDVGGELVQTGDDIVLDNPISPPAPTPPGERGAREVHFSNVDVKVKRNVYQSAGTFVRGASADVRRDLPAALVLTLQFTPTPIGAQVRWRADEIGEHTSAFAAPYRGADLAAVLRALERQQHPTFILADGDQERLRALGLLDADGELLADLPRRVGQALYTALVSGSGIAALDRAQSQALQTGRPLALRLLVPPDAVEVAALPWELLWPPQGLPLLLSTTPGPLLTRHLDLDGPLPTFEPRQGRRLRILSLVPHVQRTPDDLSKTQTELRRLWQDLETRGIAEVVAVSPVTRNDLARAMRYQPDIVQYTGHGWYAAGRGVLMLDPVTPGASADRVDAEQVAVALRGTRMAVLAACRGAQGPGIEGGSTGVLTGVAPALSAAGVPLVVGMQLGITVTAVHRAAHAIYSALAQGLSVQAAVGHARDQLYVLEPERSSWYVPVLYVRTREPGPVFV